MNDGLEAARDEFERSLRAFRRHLDRDWRLAPSGLAAGGLILAAALGFTVALRFRGQRKDRPELRKPVA